MNSRQMKKWLEQQGPTFMPGRGSHLKVFLNGNQSALPMHGTAELDNLLQRTRSRHQAPTWPEIRNDKCLTTRLP